VSDGPSVVQLAVRVAELDVRVAQLSNELEDARSLMTQRPVSGSPAPSPRYDTLDDWVREYFAPTFGRPIGGDIRWCEQWREHAEAIGRLEALWRSWEVLRLDPAMGMVSWLTNYLDPQLLALLGRAGPFSQCAVGRHAPQPGLTVTSASSY
jgi:hypothetical protein